MLSCTTMHCCHNLKMKIFMFFFDDRKTYWSNTFLSVWDHGSRNNTTLDCTEVWGIKDVEAPVVSHAQMLTGCPAVRDSRVTMCLYNLSWTDICMSTIEQCFINTIVLFFISLCLKKGFCWDEWTLSRQHHCRCMCLLRVMGPNEILGGIHGSEPHNLASSNWEKERSNTLPPDISRV